MVKQYRKTRKGGLKKRYPTKSGFKPIYDMIVCPNNSFEVLTMHSLFGFMVKLRVGTDCAEYYNLNDQRTAFDTLERNYLLKFVILSPNEEKGNLSFYNNWPKSSEIKSAFIQESRIQQQLWQQSVKGGTLPICPSVVNLTIFTAEQANSLLIYICELEQKYKERLFEKITSDSEKNPEYEQKIKEEYEQKIKKLSNLMTYFSENQHEVGVMTQVMLEDSITLSDFIVYNNKVLMQLYNREIRKLVNKTKTDDLYDKDILMYRKNVIASGIAQVLRLYLFHGIVHQDLHSNNILFDGKDCYIIDFGRILMLKNSKSKIKNYEIFVGNYKIYFNYFHTYHVLSPKFIDILVDQIVMVGKDYELFRTFKTYIKDDQSIYIMVSNKFKEYTIYDIDELIKSNEIENIDKLDFDLPELKKSSKLLEVPKIPDPPTPIPIGVTELQTEPSYHNISSSYEEEKKYTPENEDSTSPNVQESISEAPSVQPPKKSMFSFFRSKQKSTKKSLLPFKMPSLFTRNRAISSVVVPTSTNAFGGRRKTKRCRRVKNKMFTKLK